MIEVIVMFKDGSTRGWRCEDVYIKDGRVVLRGATIADYVYLVISNLLFYTITNIKIEEE